MLSAQNLNLPALSPLFPHLLPYLKNTTLYRVFHTLIPVKRFLHYVLFVEIDVVDSQILQPTYQAPLDHPYPPLLVLKNVTQAMLASKYV